MRPGIARSLHLSTRIASALAGVLLVATPCLAILLPERAWTTADGLPADEINCLIEDARGFLWIGTPNGLARFDGRSFRVYGPADGLTPSSINDILEADDGGLWLATAGGLSRLEVGADGTVVRTYPVDPDPTRNRATALERDRSGRIWVGTTASLLLLQPGDGAPRLEAAPLPFDRPPGRDVCSVEDLAGGADGSLWIATGCGLVRRLPDGRMIPYPIAPASTVDDVRFLLADDAGRIWISHGATGVNVLVPEPAAALRSDVPLEPLQARADRATPSPGAPVSLPSNAGETYRYGEAYGVHFAWASPFARTADGSLWIGCAGSLTRFDGARFRIVRLRSGDDLSFRCALGDRGGNLWLGTAGQGLLRITPGGLSTYLPEDGLGARGVAAIVQDRQGVAVAVARGADEIFLTELGADTLEPVRLRLPRRDWYAGWGWGQIAAQAPDGSWWILTGEGLLHYPAVPRLTDLKSRAPIEALGARETFGGWDLFRLFQDSRGDLWTSQLRGPALLHRSEGGRGTFRPIGEDDGLPYRTPTAFAEDRSGAVWLGFYTGGLARFRAGVWQIFGGEDGVPPGFIGALHVDRQGRLWVAAHGGLARAEDPGAEAPRFLPWSGSGALSSDYLESLAEDAAGRLYLGSVRGVDLLGPDDALQRSFTLEDGLAGGHVLASRVDRGGSVWFGTDFGLSRLDLADLPSGDPPSVWITGVSIAGRPYPVSELGQRAVEDLVLPAGPSGMEIRFIGLGFSLGERARYRYRLGGGAWSAPFTQPVVNLAGLSAGRYRFEVGSLGVGDRPGADPAVVTFQVLPPFYRRGWFLGLVVAAVTAAAVLAHRTRVARAVALERQRAHIAMDLHDEMGSGLGSIGVLADLAASEESTAARRTRLLGQIAETASDLGTALSDIVWSLRDRDVSLEALARHLQERAHRLLPGPEPRLKVEFPEALSRIPLSLAVRRNVFRVGLEALHNASRHARASQVVLGLRPEGRRWRLSVADDGQGVGDSPRQGDPPAVAGGGYGLETMRERARSIGATLEIASNPGGGTTVLLVFDPGAAGHGANRGPGTDG